MNIGGLVKAGERFFIENSPGILTALGVTGALTTAFLTGKATFRAAELLQTEKLIREDRKVSTFIEPKETFLLVWKEYIPAAGTAVVTVAAIIAANQIGTRRAAAVAAAYSISENAFREYREKIVDRIGSKKEEEVRADIAKEKIEKNPPSSQIIILGSEVVCFDEFSGRYFPSSMEKLRKAQNDINYKINNEMYASLGEFYDLVGLEPTSVSADVGWNADRLLELRFAGVLSPDGRPALSIDYNIGPIMGFCRVN